MQVQHLQGEQVAQESGVQVREVVGGQVQQDEGGQAGEDAGLDPVLVKPVPGQVQHLETQTFKFEFTEIVVQTSIN